MGATTYRVPKVLTSNTTAANTGTDILTLKNDDVILFDRSFTQVTDGTTVQNSANADQLYVVVGGADGVIAYQQGIQTTNIRKVIVTPYKAPIPFAATIAVGTATSNTDYVFKIILRDEHSTAPGHSAPRSYTYTSDSTATAVEIAQGIADAVNKDKYSQSLVTATVDGAGNFTVTAVALAPDLVADYEFVTFDVALPAGFSTGATITYTPGTTGAGVGLKVRDLERNANNYGQRRLWPIPVDVTRAVATNKYNLVTIEHDQSHLADQGRPITEPMKCIVAFAASPDTVNIGQFIASPKQTAFLNKLTSVVESVGVFVQ